MLDLASILTCIGLVLGLYPVPPTNWWLMGLAIASFILALFCILYHCYREDRNEVVDTKKEGKP